MKNIDSIIYNMYVEQYSTRTQDIPRVTNDVLDKAKEEFYIKLLNYFNTYDEPDGSGTRICLKDVYMAEDPEEEIEFKEDEIEVEIKKTLERTIDALEIYINSVAPYLDQFKKGNEMLNYIISGLGCLS